MARLEPMANDLPEELNADYVNTGVESALAALRESPNYTRLAEFLLALRHGHLFADVTGAVSKRKGARVRTIRSTRGQLLLPLFTSMTALRAAVESGGRKTGSGGKADEPKGILMPIADALELIRKDRFVAVQFNPGDDELVVLRKYIDLVLSGDPIDAERLESMK